MDTVLGSLGDEENGVKAYEVLESFKGKDLEYKEYEPLFACAGECAAKQNKKAKRAWGRPLLLLRKQWRKAG